MNRLFSMLCLLGAPLVCFSAYADMTESVALERAMAQPHIRGLLEAQLEQAKGVQDSAGRWDNPEIEYSQENLDLRAGRSEETSWWLRQRLNIAGSKGLERDAGAMGVQAAEARVLLARWEWRARIRAQFYAALSEQTRAEVLDDHHRRLQNIAKMIEQRVAEGDASRYDSLRIAQALAQAQSISAEAQAEQRAEHQRLFSLVGGAPDVLTGALLPPPVESGKQMLEQSSEQTLEQHPRLKMLAALEESASLNAKAARRKAWPEISVGVGRKTLDEAGYSAEGNAIALSVEIPLFDRNQGEARRARGLAHEYAAEQALTRIRLRTERQSLQSTLAAQRESAQALWQAVTNDEDSLSSIAEASYQMGELSIMELLDAYRTELDTWQRYIESAKAARATFIQLQQLEGQ